MNTTTTDRPVTEPTTGTTGAAEARAGLRGLLVDVGLPMGTYYGLHALGCPDSAALLAATVAAAARVAVVAVRARRVSAFGALMLGVYAVGLVLSFVSGDPRFMLLKDSAGTAVVGIGFLVSLLSSRPMLLAAMEGMRPARAADLARQYAADPRVRRTVRGLTVLWGVGLLAEAVLRIPVVYALPISVGVAVSHLLTLAATVVLGLVTALWVRTAQRRAHAG